MNSWSANTKKSYDPYLKEFATYCSARHICIDDAFMGVEAGIDFLTHLFKVRKLSHSSVGNARSALSPFISVEGVPFGEHPWVTRLLKGMFRERPSLPKYTVTYDAGVVLDYLRGIPLENITLKMLSHKLVTLMCFLTGQRDQTLNSLDMNFMHRTEEKYIFYLPTLLKTSTPKFHTKPLQLLRYTTPSLCVVAHIDAYIEATKHIRGDPATLLVSMVPPHKKVTTTTISRWVKDTLEAAGINIKVFSSHSTRHSSTSLAKVKGLSLENIRDAAGWSNCTTFATFYDKPIVVGQNFGETILS